MIQSHKVIRVQNLLLQFPLIVEEETKAQGGCHLLQSHVRKGQPLQEQRSLRILQHTVPTFSVYCVCGGAGGGRIICLILS